MAKYPVYFTAWVLTGISGMLALGHEVLWTRRMVDLLGASTESMARVFGSFFLGLALGAALAGCCIHRVQHPWRAAALAETGIALFTLPLLLMNGWMDPFLQFMGAEWLTSREGGWIRWALSLLLVAVPAGCMGWLLPTLFRAVELAPSQPPHPALGLYIANTVGGLLGLGAMAFLGLPNLGVQSAMNLLVLGNLGIATACWWLHRRSLPTAHTPHRTFPNPIPTSEGEHPGRLRPQVSEGTASDTTPLPFREWRTPVLLAFLSGFGILAAEVVLFQMFQLAAIVSIQTTSLLLWMVILSLTAASVLAPIYVRHFQINTLMSWALGGAALAFAVTPLIFFEPAIQSLILAPTTSTVGRLLRWTGVLISAFGPVLLLTGFVFPLLLAGAGRQQRTLTPTYVAVLLSVNGLGALVGAEIAHAWLLPNLGLHRSLGALSGVYAVTAVFWLRTRGIAWGSMTPAWAAIALLVGHTQFRLKQLPEVNTRAGFEVLSVRFGREGQVAVVEHPQAGRALLMSNQYLLGGTRAMDEQERQGHIPLMFHEHPRSVAFIGMATGSTARAALDHDGVETCVVLEISQRVLDAAREYFPESAGPLFEDPRALVLREDGRTFLAASRDEFDGIVADLFLPWENGAGRLYSREHFRSVHRALKDGGVFCQWLPMHQLTLHQFLVCAATLGEVFPKIHLIRANTSAALPVLGLLCWKGDDLDWNRVRVRAGQVEREARILDRWWLNEAALKRVYLGSLNGNKLAVIPQRNTLGNAWIELNAGATRLAGSDPLPYLSGDRWTRFLSTELAEWLENRESF